jgi:hypothetical protein
MSISSQSLGLGTREQLKLDDLLNNATPRRLSQLQHLMAQSTADVIADSTMTAANVKSKIAARLRINIPEITRP